MKHQLLFLLLCVGASNAFSLKALSHHADAPTTCLLRESPAAHQPHTSKHGVSYRSRSRSQLSCSAAAIPTDTELNESATKVSLTASTSLTGIDQSSISPALTAARVLTPPVNPGSIPPYSLTKQQLVYLFLTNTFVTCLIAADVIGVKIFEIKFPFSILGHSSVEHTCGMLTFPITFLLGDLINEYYGAKATKTCVYIGLVMSILVFLVMNVAQALPYLNKPFNVTPEAFNMIFGTAKLMYIASISAYFVGQMLDIYLFGFFKRLTKGKMLWLRATGSTLISQLMDSFVVSYVAFNLGKKITGQVPAAMSEIWSIAITGYSLKFVISALITPLLYLIKSIMHNKFGLEPLPVEYNEDEKKPF